MIVLDLEWNQPFGGRRMEEVIQIGAVRLAEPGGAVQDWLNMHVKPVIYPKLSPVARKLPESAQALTADVCFPEAYQAFLDWCGGDTLWAEWGAQDHGVLAANAAYWKLPSTCRQPSAGRWASGWAAAWRWSTRRNTALCR